MKALEVLDNDAEFLVSLTVPKLESCNLAGFGLKFLFCLKVEFNRSFLQHVGFALKGDAGFDRSHC